MISTRGRYALRVMAELAKSGGEKLTPLKEIAERQDISLKYLEGIMAALSKAGLVNAAHGKGGGYSLVKPPSEYSIGDILRVTESSYIPIACLTDDKSGCQNAASCTSLPMWEELRALIEEFFENKHLSDLI